MPSLFRFLTVVAVIAGVIYGTATYGVLDQMLHDVVKA